MDVYDQQKTVIHGSNIHNRQKVETAEKLIKSRMN